MRVNSLFRIEIPRVLDVNLMLRALAVIVVIYWHVHGYRAEGYIEKISTVSGRFAVWVFFVLSGYLIGLSLITRYTFSLGGGCYLFIETDIFEYCLFFSLFNLH